MKNIKALGLLLLALLTGLAAAVYAAGWVSRQGGIASNKVVVAAVDIELGSRVNPQMLSLVDWPSGSLPAGSFKDAKSLEDRVVKVGVLRGEAILEGKLAPVGTQGGLSAVIASGKRAMTVRVNDVVGVAGFALPGNYVDVMVNAQQDKNRGEEGRQISKTVLEKVLVLAVAQEANRDDTKPKVVSAVTLELSLEDSEKLDLARSVGNPLAGAAQPDGQDHGCHRRHHQGPAVRREGHPADLHHRGSAAGPRAHAAHRPHGAAAIRVRGSDPARSPHAQLLLITPQEEPKCNISLLLLIHPPGCWRHSWRWRHPRWPRTRSRRRLLPLPQPRPQRRPGPPPGAAPRSSRTTSRPTPCSASRWSSR